MHRARLVAALALAAMLLSLSFAAADDKGGKGDKGKAVGDEEFVKQASAAGLAEVNAADLALRFAASPDVRQFAAQMKQDHTKSNNELTGLANTKQLKMAEKMDATHEKMYQKMGKLSGADFDKEYIRSQVRDHEKAVSLFEGASKSAKDPQLKQWAAATLPTLRMHLKMSQEMADRHRVGTGDRTGAGKTGDRDRDRDRDGSRGSDRSKDRSKDRDSDRNKDRDKDRDKGGTDKP